jgi:preprotein translocase subunit SecE
VKPLREKSGGWGFESLHPCHNHEVEEVDNEMSFVMRVREFSQEVLAEFRKVTWPSRQELVNSTVVVVAVTVVLAFFLGGVDIVLAAVVERILR